MDLSFKERLKRGDLLIGTFLTIPSLEIAEILASAGFDWIFVDMEHAPFSLSDVLRILQVTEGKCPCIVRIPVLSEVWIKQVLDAGPAGIIIPHVNSADEVKKILNFGLYPPEGSRSVGISRAQEYGLKFKEYLERANHDIVVIPQVEHIEGVSNIQSIVEVPGISAIFLGPYDLSGSLGILGKVNEPEILESLKTVKLACRKAGVPTGIFGADVQAVKPYIDKGHTLIAVGTDTLMLGKTAKKIRSLLR